MMTFLCKSKATILNVLKLLPATHMAEGKDFEIWGCQFVNAIVSHIQIGWVDIADQTLPRMLFMACPIDWDAWRTMLK
jgi:hypothetical protein